MPASKYCFGFETLFQRQSIVTRRPIVSINGILNDDDIGADISADAVVGVDSDVDAVLTPMLISISINAISIKH